MEVFLMIYENTGGVPNVMTSTGGYDGDRQGSYWWIFALVLVFFALIFWRRDGRDETGLNGILPALALGKINKGDDYCHEHWSLYKEQSDIKKEIMQVGWQTDKSVLENRTAMALGFKENEILGLKSTAEIMARIDNLEKSFKNDEIRRLESKVNFLDTVMAIRPPGAIPAIPHAYYPMHNPCAAPAPAYA